MEKIVSIELRCQKPDLKKNNLRLAVQILHPLAEVMVKCPGFAGES